MTTATEYETAAAVPAAPVSRRAEQREDRRLQAELELAREAARAEQRRADERAWGEERRQARAARGARRAEARASRARARQVRAAWLRSHVTDLLFVPVIGVPGALAWDAMAAYGTATWGPLGIALPLFSEGAMWAFDAAIAIRRRTSPDAPVWHLQAGLVIFAAFGAALNFLHGVAPTTAHRSLTKAMSMALVSVAGVTAHQLVIAGPRQSRAERELARFRREAERRQAAARQAASRMALVDIDEAGHADLVYEPGTYRLSRSLTGGRRLAAPRNRPAAISLPAPDRSSRQLPVEETASLAWELAQPARIPVPQPAASAGWPAVPEPDARDVPAGHAGFPPPEFYGPDADRDDSAGEDVAEWAGWAQDAVAEQLASQISAATTAGTTWKPDYEQLIALTDKSKRWCEAAVSKARRLAEDPARDNGTDGGETSRSSPGGPGIAAGAPRMPVFRAPGEAAEII